MARMNSCLFLPARSWSPWQCRAVWERALFVQRRQTMPHQRLIRPLSLLVPDMVGISRAVPSVQRTRFCEGFDGARLLNCFLKDSALLPKLLLPVLDLLPLLVCGPVMFRLFGGLLLFPACPPCRGGHKQRDEDHRRLGQVWRCRFHEEMNLHPCDPQAAFLAARPAGSSPRQAFKHHVSRGMDSPSRRGVVTFNPNPLRGRSGVPAGARTLFAAAQNYRRDCYKPPAGPLSGSWSPDPSRTPDLFC